MPTFANKPYLTEWRYIFCSKSCFAGAPNQLEATVTSPLQEVHYQRGNA